MKKHLKKLRPLLLLTTLFLLTNCQEEFEENKAVVQQKNGSKHTILTGEAARSKKAELLVKLNKDGGSGLAKLQNVLKGGTTDPAFRQLMDIKEYIDDSEVYSIEQANGNINNTFRVNMPDAGDNKFYNLVVKTAGTASKTVLLTYNLSKEFAEEYQNGGDILHFSGEIEFDILAIDEDFPCEEEPGKPTPVSGGSGSGGGGGGGGTSGGGTGGGGIGGPGNPGDPGVPYNQSLVDQKFQHLKFMAVINWGGDEEWELVSRSPRYFRTGKIETGDIENLCGDAEDIGVLDPNAIHKKNCEELNAMMARPGIKASFTTLQSKANSFREFGHKFEDNKSPEELQLAPGSIVSLVMPVGGDIYGANHTHPDPNDPKEVAPMFSLPDLIKFAEIRKNYTPSMPGNNAAKCVLTLTVNVPDEGGATTQTFALKIDNWLKFREYYLKYSAFTKDEREIKDKTLNRKYVLRRKSGGSTDGYMKDLFSFMIGENIEGVAIYKANKDLTEWSKQEYDKETNSITPKPCIK